MNTINTDTLRPGQIFSAPVYSEGENLLVPARVPLRQRDIDFLVLWGIDAVSTDGAVIPDEDKEAFLNAVVETIDSVDPVDPVDVLDVIDTVNIVDTLNAVNSIGTIDTMENIIDADMVIDTEENDYRAEQDPVVFSIADVQQNSASYRTYKSLIEKVAAIFTGIKSGVDIDMRVIDNISLRLLQDLHDYMDNFVAYILGGEIMGHELAKSSVNTAILSALTAQELKLPNHKINNVVSGALLHDIGMLRLSKGITEKKGGLSDAEREQIKSHPLHTSKIVTKELFGPNEVNLIALQHHERWDGNGYPDHLLGPAIDMGARIVSVADAFEAMVSKKSYRNSMSGYQAIKNLLSDNARRFDPAVIMAFTKIMGIYPIGSIVKLNDESVARVVKVHSNAPMRPVVQILIGNTGKFLKPGSGAVINLLEEKTLFIKTAMDPEEFAQLNG